MIGVNGRALVVLALLAWPLQPLDDAARAVAQGARRPWLDRPMRLATEGGRPLLIAGAGVALVAGAAGRSLLAEAAIVLVPLNLVVEGVKYATWRERPDGTRRRTNASFPSSHAANAFAVAVLLARRWRRASAAFVLLATVVAASRLYLDRHWLSDVVVGAVLGAALAWFLGRWWDARQRLSSRG